mmetsp:Transcript_21673/g.60165  ORF Transcript_21673/g.60165 Transcript_21673/m.60165 type:complete len:256 (+) Transcript_21673:74-841(+)
MQHPELTNQPTNQGKPSNADNYGPTSQNNSIHSKNDDGDEIHPRCHGLATAVIDQPQLQSLAGRRIFFVYDHNHNKHKITKCRSTKVTTAAAAAAAEVFFETKIIVHLKGRRTRGCDFENNHHRLGGGCCYCDDTLFHTQQQQQSKQQQWQGRQQQEEQESILPATLLSDTSRHLTHSLCRPRSPRQTVGLVANRPRVVCRDGIFAHRRAGTHDDDGRRKSNAAPARRSVVRSVLVAARSTIATHAQATTIGVEG